MGVVVRRHFLGHAMEVVERSITDTLKRVELVGHAMEVCSSATLEQAEVAENVNKINLFIKL